MDATLALILAGGKGTRLGALTAVRAKPAMPMAGCYRLIDFTLSNCLNSGIRRVGVLTQHLAESLVPHVYESWAGHAANGEHFAECLFAGPRPYRGTADAVHQHAALIRAQASAQVLVLAGDHAYKMDYARMLAQHRERRADVTIGCIEVPLDQVHAFGVMQIDRDYRIRQFVEKPERPVAMPGRPDVALASMGIYLFDADFLLRLLQQDSARTSSHDFGKDVIPIAITARAYACRLRDPCDPDRAGYWRDVGTIDAYRQANLEMAAATAGLDLGDPDWPIQTGTCRPNVPIARRPGSVIVSADCALDAADVRHSVLFPGVRVERGTTLNDSVVLAGATIGAGSVVRNAVIEEGCVIPAGSRIGVDDADDRRRFHRTPSGSVLVTPAMLAPSPCRSTSVSLSAALRPPALIGVCRDNFIPVDA